MEENFLKKYLDTQTQSSNIYLASRTRTERLAMAKMRNYTFREMESIVLSNGYVYIRCTGSHHTYKKEGVANTIVLAKRKHVNPCIARRIIKENHLVIS